MQQKCLKTKDNLWVLYNGNEYVVGLTEAAQSDLGKVTFASLPKAGQTFKPVSYTHLTLPTKRIV